MTTTFFAFFLHTNNYIIDIHNYYIKEDGFIDMYNHDDFTKKAIVSLQKAIRTAGELGHTFVGTEHMILGFLSEGANIAGTILRNNHITENKVYDYIRKTTGCGISTILSEEYMTPRLKKAFSDAVINSQRCGATLTGSEYILYEILKNKSGSGTAMLKELGADISKIKSECIDSDILPPKTSYTELDERKYPTICKYSKDFTAIAFENGFDPVIGREKEIERVIQILSRKNKNNPCLVGEAGVGKTAIVEGLAQNIINGNVPVSLKNKYICSLDITSMLAGARYRGDFEERIKNCLNEVNKNKDIILFIDEIHTIVGAGAAEGAIDAANILKPELARGNIQIIGATTYSEYRQYIEKDNALERRFQPVTVNEPDKKQLFDILNGLKKSYENFHMVKIPDEIINKTVTLSERYVHDRFLPDKAIDIIDEACSRATIRTGVKNKNTCDEMTDFLRKNMNDLGIENTTPSKHDTYVTEDDITSVISTWTGIPINAINAEENIRLRNLETELKKHIIGQNKAIDAISEAIRRNKVGLKDDNKPIGSFLLAGPTGVGKTELAKTIAKIMFDSIENMIRLDMSEFMEKHSVSKIIGSPPGYVGYKDSNTLADLIRKKPYSVILFDEIEKAHPDVLNILLQMTDEGEFKDSDGRKINLKNTLIILTSNVGADILSKETTLGFSTESEIKEQRNKDAIKALSSYFKPELLNRMDEIIVFSPLENESLKKISEIFLDELVKRAENINIKLNYSNKLPDYILCDEETKKYGARPLKRAIKNKIEKILTEKILKNEILSGDSIFIDIDDSDIKLVHCNKSESTIKV